MWGKKIHQPKIDTVIGHNTKLAGDIEFNGGLHLDGMVQGNVIGGGESSATLTISESGVVEGDVRVPNVIVNGKVFGDVYASNRIELAPNAQINGCVYYQIIEMASGAVVNGNMVRQSGQESAENVASGKKTASEKKSKEPLNDMLTDLISQEGV